MHCSIHILSLITAFGLISSFSTTSQSLLVTCQEPDDAKETQEKQFSEEEQALIEVTKQLSRSTLEDGAGWKKYQTFLHDDFTRWSSGGQVCNRKQNIEAIKNWWEDGYRQKSSNSNVVSIQIRGGTGVVRKTMAETYVDSEGNPAGEFNGSVTQVWLKEDAKKWKLFAVTIHQH